MRSLVAFIAVVLSVSALAQQPAPPKPPAAPPAPAAAKPPEPPRPPNPDTDPLKGQRVNIRLDVSVTDQGEGAATQPKTLMVMLADRATGRTRGAFQDRSISVDATPIIVDGRIRLDLTVQSRGDAGPGKTMDNTLFWQNSFALLLDSGKPMLAFETLDPATKRKLSIEVKATILK